MKYKLQTLLILTLVISFGCKNQTPEDRKQVFYIQNPMEIPLKDAIIRISMADLEDKINGSEIQEITFLADDQPIPSQWNDLNRDGFFEEVLLLLELKPHEDKKIYIQKLQDGEALPVFKKRTQAEVSPKKDGKWVDRKYVGGAFHRVDRLRVPAEHTDHSEFIRYEGPGWESDKVGYRFYLDWRNANDIFGKKTDTLVLQYTGLDGFDSYHEPAPWGMDILKVGESLGIGSIANYSSRKAHRVEITDSITTEIISNGDLESRIRTNYYGWKTLEEKTDLTADLWIQAGSRLTSVRLKSALAASRFCTGIVKLDSSILLENTLGSWGYLASFGRQSLANDRLGMAVIYTVNSVDSITSDDLNHLVIFKPGNPLLEYHFLAAWEQELDGIKELDAFKQYLDELLAKLNQPPQVRFNQN